MPLRRQENCLEGEHRVFEALIMPWTPSLLPQTILFLHFLKMQFGFDDAGGCVRHWESKEERRSQGIHSPAEETMYQRMGQNSQQSGFWRTGLGPALHRPISSFPDVHFAWVPVFSPRWLPVTSISILPLSQIQQHSTGTSLSSFLPEDALACSWFQLFPGSANLTKCRTTSRVKITIKQSKRAWFSSTFNPIDISEPRFLHVFSRVSRVF